MARVLVALACLLLPTAASAQTEPGRFELIALTEVPQYLGGGLSVGLGRRFRVQSTVGASVAPYVGAVHAVVSSATSLDASLDEPLRAAVHDFIVWRTHAVWRPWERYGFELGAGYGLVVVRGNVSDSLALRLAQTMPSDSTLLPPPYVIRAWLHQADVEFAWRVPVHPSLAFRFALDLGVTALVQTTITTRYNVGDSPETQAILDASEATVSDWMTRWRLLPGLSVALHLTF